MLRLSRIKKLCVDAARAVLLTEVGPDGELRRQWISNGSGMWVTTGMPVMGQENLQAILGLSGKQTEKMRISMQEFPEGYDGGDLDSEDEPLQMTMLTLSTNRHGYRLLTGNRGQVYLVDQELLTPVWTEDSTLALRFRSETQPYIVILDGFFAVGIVIPATTPVLEPEEAGALRRLLRSYESHI